MKAGITLISCYLFFVSTALASPAKSESVYKGEFSDPEAFYFTSENYDIKADGKTDVTEALQSALNDLKMHKNFGIIFIPEGTYRISKTIHVPPAIRLIGYGQNRPLFVLGKDTPGYQTPDPDDKAQANYMFWFTGAPVTPGQPIRDAHPGTFYSAFSNIDLKIEAGNPTAIALRTHYAQHGFVSHCDIHIGDGKAGIFDVGNELENVRFFGGNYGIMTTTPSPSWPMMMVDTYFEGQRKAAIRTRNAGLAIVAMHVKDSPVAVEIEPDKIDRLFLENCLFENVREAGIVVSYEDNSLNQINLLNVACKDVPTLVKFRPGNTRHEVNEKMYRVKRFTYGLCMDEMTADAEYKTISDIEPLQDFPPGLTRSIPSLPDMSTWVNIRDLGAKGDGETDDTKVFREAIAKYEHIYVPQGWYRLTETLKMVPNTCLIGLHPFATQFTLAESTPAFSGFGGPKPLIESSEGGNNIFNGIGINTGAYNYRAVGCKWMAGAGSLLNDVKFVGGHGTMRKGPYEPFRRNSDRQISSPDAPVRARGKDLAWDSQYWSLWVTNNGGGALKDIWTASSYAASGLYVNNTSTPGRIYAMSLEHHVRNEARFNNVANWKMYAFQLEEEGIEGPDCQPIELVNCRELMFANLWQYRVIRVTTPRHTGVRLWNCKNINFYNVHTYTQKLFVTEIPVYDINKNLKVFPWEFASLTVTGEEPEQSASTNGAGHVKKLVSGFEFAQGIASDSKGNIYFCETRMRRIYKWSVETNSLSLIADFPWQPFTLAFDTEDNLLVVFRYDPQPGLMINGKQETVPVLPDDNPLYSGWGHGGWAAWVYSVDPDNPEETIQLLPRAPTSEIKNIHQALYPTSRWRYDFDETIVWMPDSCFVAPDNVTILPEIYDLGRCASLSPAFPGKPFYVSDETLKRIVKLDVADNGRLSNMQNFVQRGEYGVAIDKSGNIYVADGKIYVYDKEGNKTNSIELDERPVSIQFGGKEGNTLFITTSSSLYSLETM